MKEDRVRELARKILLPENEPIRKYANKWVTDSRDWVKRMVRERMDVSCEADRTELMKRYQLLYILNHLCTSLAHFERSPKSLLSFEMDQYSEVSTRYWNENSQKGVEKSSEKLDQLLYIWNEAGLISDELSKKDFNSE